MALINSFTSCIRTGVDACHYFNLVYKFKGQFHHE